MKTIHNIEKYLDKEDSLCCFNENSCLLKYGIIPFVDYIIKPIWKSTKKILRCIIMPIESCTFGSIGALTTQNK